MHRSSLIKLLEGYRYQPEIKGQILDFIVKNPDCLERTNLSGHITSSAWLLSSDLSKALLLHHQKLDIWVQPGGHCDGESDVLASALREAIEESGIENIKTLSNDIFDLDIHLIPEKPGEPLHYHYDIRFLLQAHDDNFRINNESKDMIWLKNDLSNLTTTNLSILRMIDKWRSL